jgi:WD40 repeat protein
MLMTGHLLDVNVVEFSGNTQFVVSGSSDRTIRVWETSSGN